MALIIGTQIRDEGTTEIVWWREANGEWWAERRHKTKMNLPHKRMSDIPCPGPPDEYLLNDQFRWVKK